MPRSEAWHFAHQYKNTKSIHILSYTPAQLNAKVTKGDNIGNAVAAPNWEIYASNTSIGSIGIIYGKIVHTTNAVPEWGELVGTFPDFAVGYNIPLLLFDRAGRVYTTANISFNGEFRLYGPDYKELNKEGYQYDFNVAYKTTG